MRYNQIKCVIRGDIDMQIKAIQDYDKKLKYQKNYIKRIDFADNTITKLLDYTEEIDNDKLLKIINSINNQNIQSIDLKTFSYVNRNEKIGFSKLSKAERVFLVAYMADLKKKEIYLHTDITQLTKKTLKLFIKTFANSSYVNIVYNSKTSDAFYRFMKKEALA